MADKIPQRITVLMPVFNADRFLNESIESILAQTFGSFEFFIINDGSTDKSEEIILSYKDSRIKYLKNERNSGITFTLNRGLSAIHSEYIARMDADDVCLPHRLQRQIDFMDHNPDVGVSGAWMEVLGKPGEIFRTPLCDEDIKATLMFRSSISHPTVIIRNEVLKKNNILYSDQYIHAEDYNLWYRLKDKTKFANLNEVVLKYRYDGQNITLSKSEEKNSNLLYFYKCLLSDFGLDPVQYGQTHFNFVFRLFQSDSPKNISSQLLEFKRWGDLLKKQNSAKALYPHQPFVKIIDEIWDNLFYHIPAKQFVSFFYYFYLSGYFSMKKAYYFFKISL